MGMLGRTKAQGIGGVQFIALSDLLQSGANP